MVKNSPFTKVLPTVQEINGLISDESCSDTNYAEDDSSARETGKSHDGSGKKKKKKDPEYINTGEEDQMEIYGYHFDNLRASFTWVFYFLTCGLLRLFFHWYPQCRLFATHSQCPLGDAEKVLIVDDYKGKFKTYFVKDVKNLSSKLTAKVKAENSPKQNIQGGSDRSKDGAKNVRLSINFVGGERKMLEVKAFWCKKLCYIWDEDNRTFTKLVGMDRGITNAEIHAHEGFDSLEQFTRRITYGSNEIDVPLQTVLTLLVLEALTPFYIFQVFSLIVWCSENYYYYTIAIVIMSTVGITSSIIQTRKNQKNLRGTVQSTDKVTVCRGNDVYEDVPTTQLVPGDVISIPPHGCVMHCDAVLLNGNCIVNESMLTGESVPVTKTPLPKNNNLYDVKADANHTLFCGTKVIQTRYYGGGKVLAVVIRTGYLTSKGQLVRSIMYPPPADFKFDQDSYKFIGILAVIALCGFVYTIVSKSTRDIEPIDILIKALDLITIVIPPALPAAMTVGKLYALHRLKKGNIYCINSRIINVSGSINCVCFDKTGTLTEDGLDMWGVVLTDGDEIREPQKDVLSLPLDSPFLHGMVCCHSLTLIDGQLTGDPLDVKMFEATGWILEEPEMSDSSKYDLLVPTVLKPPARRAKDCVVDEKGQKFPLEIGIIHQHQFSSTLQRMSVVTKTLGEDHFRLFCKGSPEMIISLSRPDTVPHNILDRLKEHTKKGYRVIALAHRVLDMNFVKIQRLKRDDAECDLSFLGLIVLENRLKPQTTGVIEVLKNADIKLVMITGDNIQTALSVARECAIIDPASYVVDVTVEFVGEDPIPALRFSLAEEAHEVSHLDQGHHHGGDFQNRRKKSLGQIHSSCQSDSFSHQTVIRNNLPNQDNFPNQNFPNQNFLNQNNFPNQNFPNLNNFPHLNNLPNHNSFPHQNNSSNQNNSPNQNNFPFHSETLDLEKATPSTNYVLSMTGSVWGAVRQHHPARIPELVKRGVVFARMSSEQKQQLILELQALGYYVAMCGDGANDCGALKAAHVGISLSEAESSVASPFTSKEANISCVPQVVKEGRAALVTSFGVFKFMICYSLAEFTSAIILYGIDANLNSLQYLFIDICLILNFASFFGITKAWDKSIFKVPPMTSLLSAVPLLSIFFNISLVVGFQAIAYHSIQTYDFFEPFHYNPKDYMNFTSYENYAVFTISLFQYIIMAVVFSKGRPYRKAIYTNVWFSISILASIGVCCFITLEPSKWVMDTLELKMPPVFGARLLILGLGAVNLLVAVIVEDFFLEYLVQKKLKPALERRQKGRRKRLEAEEAYGGGKNGSTNENGLNVSGLNMNGFNVNGLNTNGLNPNGLNVNSLNVNGLNMNGLNVNGLNVNGLNVKTLNIENEIVIKSSDSKKKTSERREDDDSICLRDVSTKL